eukprot:RCo004006
MSSSLDGVQGGKLKLKGGAPLKTKGQKPKKRKAEEMALVPVPAEEPSPNTPPKPPVAASSSTDKAMDKRTPAERAYDEAMAARAAERYKKVASKTYRDSIDELNAKLSTMTEHHDIPRVGPG